MTDFIIGECATWLVPGCSTANYCLCVASDPIQKDAFSKALAPCCYDNSSLEILIWKDWFSLMYFSNWIRYLMRHNDASSEDGNEAHVSPLRTHHRPTSKHNYSSGFRNVNRSSPSREWPRLPCPRKHRRVYIYISSWWISLGTLPQHTTPIWGPLSSVGRGGAILSLEIETLSNPLSILMINVSLLLASPSLLHYLPPFF